MTANVKLRQREMLRDYQRAFVDFMKGDDATLGSVEMGLGKTAAVLTAIADIHAEDLEKGAPRRFLVVAPKKVCVNVWRQEAARWAHTKHLNVAVATGSPQNRMHALTDPKAHIVCMNYENLPWFWDQFPPGNVPFYGVVFDEIDKMKSSGSKRFTKTRYRILEIPWRVGMTGTITSENYAEVWAPAYLTTARRVEVPGLKRKWPPAVEAALGTSDDLFVRTYFNVDQYSRKIEPRPGALDAIASKLAPYMFVARAKDHLDLPELVVQDIEFDLPPKARALYEKFEEEFLLRLEAGDVLGGEEDDDWEEGEVVAANAAVMKNKLRQVCSGFVYESKPDDPEGAAAVIARGGRPRLTRVTHWLHNAKADAYRDFVSEMQGKAHLAVYGYKAEVAKFGWKHQLGSHLTDAQEEDLLRRWGRGDFKVLALHPASGGHGLNLHESGAHHIAFMTLPWSRSLYDQVAARLRRMGQKRTVVVHRFIAKGTVEEDVVRALEGKGEVQKQVLEAVRRRVKR